MKKIDLVNGLAAKAGLSKKDSAICVDAFIEVIKEGLVDDGKVAIQGFGTLEVKERAARTGVNPQTGEKLEIPARKTVTFKPSEILKTLVRE